MSAQSPPAQSPPAQSRSALIPPGLVRAVQQRLAAEHAAAEPATLARAIRAEGIAVADDAHMLTLIRALGHELTGAGPLTSLLRDPATTDVVVNGPADVRVDRGRGWEQTDVTFADEAAVQRLARRLATMAGGRLDDAHPYVDGRLPDGVRLHAVLPPLAHGGTCVSLRVLRPARFDLAELEKQGLLPGVCPAVVRAIVAARLAMVVSGGTGTGKTTLLGALLGEVDPAERIVLVEDADELQPAHPHLVHLVARAPNVEGAGEVPLRELVRQALRMRPDRVVVGEVRGAEVVDLIGALGTGHEGGAGTVHANSAQDVPARLAALAAGTSLGPDGLRAQLAGAIDVVMHLRREGVVRRLVDIAVLDNGAGGRDGGVRAVPAVHQGALMSEGAALLADRLAARGVAPPW